VNRPGTQAAPAARAGAGDRLPWLFPIWLLAFFSVWLWLVTEGGLWPVAASNWPVAAAMALGSFFAGSTPFGGGVVGFPALVFLLGEGGSLGRDFSMAVQSIGMVSASVYILSNRLPVNWSLLRPAILASLIALPVHLALIAPVLPESASKAVFACLWMSFGVAMLLRQKRLEPQSGIGDLARPNLSGVLVAAVGCGVVSLVGSGIDMIAFMVLMVLARGDLRVAIPTSVVLMAFNSVLGVSTQMALGRFDPDVFHYWLAAAPIVALGAPIGVAVVRILPRGLGLRVITVLCLAQFGWAAYSGQISAGIAIGGGLAAVALAVFIARLIDRQALRADRAA
jgi:uncharacterized protein